MVMLARFLGTPIDVLLGWTMSRLAFWMEQANRVAEELNQHDA